jgi:hypothetical protein
VCAVQLFEAARTGTATAIVCTRSNDTMNIKISEIKEMIFFIEYLRKTVEFVLKRISNTARYVKIELKSRQNVMRKE